MSLDFSNMKRIVALNEADLDIFVQAGVGYIELNDYLKPYGLWFPLDPGNLKSYLSFYSSLSSRLLYNTYTTTRARRFCGWYVCLSLLWLNGPAVRIYARKRA